MIKIIDKHKCSGCHACYNVCPQGCIQMLPDEEGFSYPIVDLQKCTDCSLCERICPIIHNHTVDNHPQAFACYNLDETIRLESSSGGLFTLLAEYTIANGGVVFGAAFDANFNVVHGYAQTLDKLGNFRGSKYVQSIIGDSYKQVEVFLNQGKQVLFSGTPCQIGGLRAYLQHEYNNLYCVDIVCHGVPSPLVWRKYVSYQECKASSSVRRIVFRRKDNGWRRYSVSFWFDNDTEYFQHHGKDLYMKAFLRDVCLRPSCYSCNFKSLHRESDITLADFWGIHHLLPEMHDDKGTSLVFINTPKGKSLFDAIKDRIVYQEVDINKAVTYNPSAIKSVEINPKRDCFFAVLNQLSFDELVNKHCQDTRIAKLKRRAKRVVNKLLRMNRQ